MSFLQRALAFAAAITVVGAPASAEPTNRPTGPALAHQLTRKVTAGGVNRHLTAFQRIADRAGGTRAAGSPGYDGSVDYVAGTLRRAGFDVSTPTFQFVDFTTLASTLTVDGQRVPIFMMKNSASTPVGGRTARLAAIPEDATTGCEASDYQNVVGAVVLVRRGGCTASQKQQVAAEAGAIAAIVSNTVDSGPVSHTIRPEQARIPIGGITKADGDALAGKPGASVAIELRAENVTRTNRSVIAQTRTGRTDHVVMAGAHLDSVKVGPGINDNGSGSAALLETALQLGARPHAANAVRFAWWGAEEVDTNGSVGYFESLSPAQRADLGLYLNFDMIGSPNAGYFVFDGDDSDHTGAGPGPEGSAQIEQTFVDYFTARGIPTEGTDLDGSSDYAVFMAGGVPVGGLFTGAYLVKTEAQAAKWGGTAGQVFDICYHERCDTAANIDRTALDRNSDALAWAIGVYAARVTGP